MDVRDAAIVVPVALRPWVSTIRAIALTGGQPVLTREPDPAVTLVFRKLPESRGDLVVLGPRPRATYHAGKIMPFGVALRFHPGRAEAILGSPVREIVDRIVPLNELWGVAGDRLADVLTDAEEDLGVVAGHLADTVLSRVSALKPRDLSRLSLIQLATTGLSAGTGRTALPVRTVADRLNISERHFHTLFTRAVGLPPKRFARVERVRTVLSRGGGDRWSRLAVDAGYYDQSHLTAEFRSTMGTTPDSYAAGHRPTPSAC